MALTRGRARSPASGHARSDDTHTASGTATGQSASAEASQSDDLISYADVRESLALILAVTQVPLEVLTSLDDAVANNAWSS